MSAVAIVCASLGLGIAGGFIGWLVGYKAGAAAMREQAAESFTNYLRRQELRP